MVKQTHGSDSSGKRNEHAQATDRRNGSIKEQLQEAFTHLIEHEEELLGSGTETVRSSNHGFQKRKPVRRKKFDSEPGNGYKEVAEENASAGPHTINGERSSTVKEKDMTAKDATGFKNPEEAFEAGRNQGKAEEAQKFAERATEHAKEAATSFWGKTKAFVHAHRGKFGIIVGVAGLAAAEAGVAAYKESRGNRSMNVGDTTVTWGPAGAQPGAQPDGGNMGGDTGTRGGRGR